MRYASRLCFLLSVLFGINPLLGTDVDGLPAPGVLVLRNGEVLAGITSKVGDRYVVAQNQGGELRIPTREVEMHCLDLEEAYLRKRERVSAKDLSARLQLADWCLRYGLYARAADELLAVGALAPHHPRLRGLERRLQSAIGLAQRSDTAPAGTPPLAQRPETRTVACQLPDEAIEGFVSRIQPLLLNRCGANACHGTRSESAFRLVAPGWGQAMTHKYTQRNLASVMQQLDSAQPDASPLLTVPAKSHAGLAEPVLGDRDQPQLETLKAWARSAVQATPPPLSVATAPGPLLQTSLQQPLPSPAAGEGVTGPGSSRQAVAASPAGHLGEPLPTLDFRDPFDPERFNRQFLEPAAPAEEP
ncbi:MAG: hypothetical protein GX575_32960 [Candidatus Anammoximicrobium sp.]|nr:hypothetical protein [Candidatus Anammoximicrobium sp.]